VLSCAVLCRAVLCCTVLCCVVRGRASPSKRTRSTHTHTHHIHSRPNTRHSAHAHTHTLTLARRSRSSLVLTGQSLSSFVTTLDALARRSHSVHPLVLRFLTCLVRFLFVFALVLASVFCFSPCPSLCLVTSLPLCRYVLCCAMLCYAVLCCAMLCYAVLCCTVRCRTCCVGWSCVTHTLCIHSRTPQTHISAYTSQCTHTHTHTHADT
jgi:hypothetical protein